MSSLRDYDALADPDNSRVSVPFFQFVYADMITAGQTAECVTPAHDMSGSYHVFGGSEMHIESLEFVFGFFAGYRHQQGLSGTDIASPGQAIH